jgi:ParB-like chromosome segregation protein Spo0J
MQTSCAQRKIEKRKLSDLRPHPLQAQVFHDTRGEELARLAEDIKANGLNCPVEITPENVIICGHRRVKAARQLNWDEIEVWVRQDPGARATPRSSSG